MRRDHLVIAAGTAVAVLVTSTAVSAYVKAAITVPLLLMAPGHVWSSALLHTARTGGHRGGWAERAAIDAGLSMALLVIGGLLVAVVRLPLEQATWLLLVAVLVAGGIVADEMCRRRRRTLNEHPDGGRGGHIVPVQPVRLRRPLVLASLAAIVTTAAIVTAIAGAKSTPATRFTSLGFVSGAGGWGAVVVHNDEGNARSYLLVITAADGATQRIALTIPTGASWQRSVPLDVGTAADLYLVDSAGRAGSLYRSVELRSRPGSP
jgi:hypothetical protein